MPDECYSDPLLDMISSYNGGRGSPGGAGWYYTINDSPRRGTFGPFEKFSDLMEHADNEVFRFLDYDESLGEGAK